MLHTDQGHAREPVRVRERPGFASTAAYFERSAQKEVRDYDRRQRLLEMAHFYRSLAGIIPGMPDGYKVSDGVGLPVTRAQRWRARAEECRTLADCFTDPTCRRQLRDLAETYERMTWRLNEGRNTVLQNLSKEIRECHRRAEECRRLAQTCLTESGKTDYLDMERRWLSLARSYEFAERLSDFTAPFTKAKQRKE